MTGVASGGQEVHRRPGPRQARMVLDANFAIEGPVVDLLRAELDQGVDVHVVLVRPQLGWSINAALGVLHRRRIAVARSSRLAELAHIAGARRRQITVSIQRHPWRAAAPTRNLESYLSHRPDQEGIVLR